MPEDLLAIPPFLKRVRDPNTVVKDINRPLHKTRKRVPPPVKPKTAKWVISGNDIAFLQDLGYTMAQARTFKRGQVKRIIDGMISPHVTFNFIKTIKREQREE